MASAAHIWFIVKKRKKYASACFAVMLCCCLPLSSHPSAPPASSSLTFSIFSFMFNFSSSHTLFIFLSRVCLSTSFPIPFDALFFLVSSLHYPVLPCSLSLLFQTHCTETLSSPHINPSLPYAVPHTSIPTGSYIFLHLDTACVT